MRQINFGFDFITLSASWTRTPGCGMRFGSALEVRSHFDRFVFFDGTGVGLFLRHTHDGQYIENRFAFDFQLPSQIVDSNLTHPPSISSACPVKPSYQPHGISVLSSVDY
jgi:hypothetical protein